MRFAMKRGATPFAIAVARVVQVCSDKEMVRINAWRIVASVANE
jgi:hypothetical protein